MPRPFRQSHLAGLVAALLLATPGAAHAADPLLSGYAGPGGGEQSVLGSRLIPPATGNGSLRSTKVVRAASGTTRRGAASGTAGRGASAAARSSAGAATATTAAAGTTGAPGGTAPGATALTSAASRRAATPAVTAPAAARQGATASAAAPAAAPAPRIGDAPATTTVIPLSHRQVLLGLAGLLLVGLCAWGTVVLAGPRRRPGRSA